MTDEILTQDEMQDEVLQDDAVLAAEIVEPETIEGDLSLPNPK